jgi:flagellar M-ring protein FliF
MLANLQSQLQNFWQRQSNTQRIILISVGVVLLIVVPVLLSWAFRPSYGTAFSGLSEADAGQIVEKLDAEGIPYQIKNGSTIMVPTDQVYEVRLAMAREGLPEGGTVGLELFDGSTLGMTEFTQRVNYQRALEGELERTIASLDAVAAVRVHIVTPEETLLTSEQAPTTASITIETKPTKSLNAGQVRAITYLVANAVENLDPENVVLVDTAGNLLAAGGQEDGLSVMSGLDSRRAVEQAAANELQLKVKNLLDTALGPNRSVVQVTVALDWNEKEVLTEAYDPEPPALSSSQTINEAYATDGQLLSGIPGAATNLPDAITTIEQTEGGNAYYQRSEETNNYEVSKTESKEVIPPGAIKQVSLSVLVDGVTDTQQLQTLQAAITAAVGIDNARGDLISVQSLTFDRTFSDAQAEELQKSEQRELFIMIAEILAVLLALGFILWYVQRLLRNLRMASAEVWTPVLKPVSEMATISPGVGEVGPAMMPSQEQLQSYLSQMAQPVSPEGPEFERRSETEPQAGPTSTEPPKLPDLSKIKPKVAVPTPEEEQMLRLMSRMATENPSNVAEIIQLWLNQDKQENE